MEVEDPVGTSAREFHERRRGVCGRRRRAVQVGGQIGVLGGSAGDAGADEGGRVAGQHRRAVEGEWLRAEEGRARRVEYVRAHVVSVGPDGEVRIVEEVVTHVKTIAVIGAAGIARGRDGDALVRHSYAVVRELADDPAVGELVIEHDGIAVTGGFARTAKAGPDRGDCRWPE